jgi:hypothetical protein
MVLLSIFDKVRQFVTKQTLVVFVSSFCTSSFVLPYWAMGWQVSTGTNNFNLSRVRYTRTERTYLHISAPHITTQTKVEEHSNVNISTQSSIIIGLAITAPITRPFYQ